MNKLTRLLCSLTLLLAVAGCQSPSPGPAVLLQKDTIKVRPLPGWILQAAQQPQVSMDELQRILNGCGRPGTTPSSACSPAPPLTAQ